MSPKSKDQFAKIRAESEEKILNAGLELFAEHGYQATSIAQIAKQAGVSKGLMYNYFESKQALLRKIISQAIEESQRIVDHALEDYEKPEEELEHLVMDSIDYVKQNFNFFRLISLLSFQKKVMESIIDLVEDNKKLSMAKGVELFTKLGSPTPLESALLLGAALDGLMLYYIHMKDELPLEKMGRKLVQTFTDKNSIHRGPT